MQYLNLDIHYFEHVKTLRLVSSLGRGADLLPIRLWRHCAQTRAYDGKLIGYSPEEIELFAGWHGKPGQAVEQLLRVGFLEKLDDGYMVHDFAIEQGHLAAFSERASKAARVRWDRYKSNATSNAQASVEQCPNLLTNQLSKEEIRKERLMKKLREGKT